MSAPNGQNFARILIYRYDDGDPIIPLSRALLCRIFAKQAIRIHMKCCT